MYKAPAFTTNIADQIKVTVTDACARSNFAANIVIGDVTLPISLSLFTGKRDGNNVQLKWITESEINNEYFTLERSYDGKDFVEVGRVDGAGNSNKSKYYYWTDDNPPSGECYYRLSQTDYDGRTETFNTVFIKADTEIDLKHFVISPSAFSQTFNVEVKSAREQKGTLIITSLKGEIIDQADYYLSKGVNTLEYNENKFIKPGMYIVVFTDDDKNIRCTKVLKN